MIACYCRVSTQHQKNDSQKAEIKNWLKANRLSGAQWYEDKESGTTTNREAFNQLQEDIFAGTIKTVIVWKLDRISRQLRDGINIMAEWCDKGVRVISITQNIDLNGAMGRMLASVMFGLAEIEMEYRRERQAAGIAVAKKKRVYKGRKKGTTKGKPARAKELKIKGLKIEEIANAMNLSKRTILRYLQ